MGFFDDGPAVPLAVALRRYWLPFALMALEPFIAGLVSWIVPDILLVRAITAVPAFLAALYPAALGAAPASYWFLACGAWFACLLAVLVFTQGWVTV
ncbi:hypothetical protein [Dokdonella koreensis]|uniref:hypothetical protein n=1 Tax=Dokdonella koreensis TaxID=323415 RepID=UPI0012372CBE|nr:hypothetical protein [Dokdonella koreensis]